MKLWEGLNGYSGKILYHILNPPIEIEGEIYQGDGTLTRGERVTIKIDWTDSAGNPLPGLSGTHVVMAFSTEHNCEPSGIPDAIIPLIPNTSSHFGELSSDFTFNLPEGTIYITLYLVGQNGEKDIIDMGIYEIGPCVDPR